MLSEKSLGTITDFWASRLGCPSAMLFSEPQRIVTHGGELKGYNGLFALFRHGTAIVSIPNDCPQRLRDLLSTQRLSSATLIEGFTPMFHKISRACLIFLRQALS